MLKSKSLYFNILFMRPISGNNRFRIFAFIPIIFLAANAACICLLQSSNLNRSGRKSVHFFNRQGFLYVVVLFVFCVAVSCAAPGPAAGEEGLVNIREFGAASDGITDDSETMLQAFARLGDNGGSLVIPRGNYLIEDLEIPGNITLVFRSGGVLVVPEGSQLKIDGTIEAGIEQIFSGDGSVSGQIKNLQVYPQWFGARGDGVHNDAPALQKAADLAAGSMGFTLFIPDGDYLFEDDLRFSSNIESQGLLVKQMEIDEERTQFSYFTFVPTHHPKNNPHIYFEPDHEELELSADPFYGVSEGQFNLPAYRDVPLADHSGNIDLAEGGTIRFYSSDFFSSRNNQKGDQFYDRNDISRIVSGRGDIFPELAFSYHLLPHGERWSESGVYSKGDYVRWGEELFKATWPSGPGSIFEDRFLGTVDIGPVRPEPGEATTQHDFTFDDGSEDRISIWRRVQTRVWYRPADRPVTVNGLRVELRLEKHEGESKRINAGAVIVSRSNMTFNNMEIRVRDREATIARLLTSSQVVNNEYNNGYFSGATYHGLGYNILNSNVADMRYYNTVSVNSRKGLDGRHGKNIAIIGGHFGVIDDHYGRNYVIRDVVVSGRSTNIPGYVTPDANLQEWGFRTIRPFGFSGANFHIENVTISGGSGGILSARGDIGDLYGTVTVQNITVRDNEGDVRLINHSINPDFDFASEVRSPGRLLVEDVHLENSGRLTLKLGDGFEGGTYGPVIVRNSGPFGEIHSTSVSLRFTGCSFENAEFNIEQGSLVRIHDCTFYGSNSGLDKDRIESASGNIRARGAEVSFPIQYLNRELFEAGN